MGGMATAALMIYAGDAMPNWLLLILIFIASAAAGLIWGLIPAVFKAYFNTNETLFTLMLNYVAMQLVTFAIVFWENPSGSNTVGIINAAGHKGWFPSNDEALRCDLRNRRLPDRQRCEPYDLHKYSRWTWIYRHHCCVDVKI